MKLFSALSIFFAFLACCPTWAQKNDHMWALGYSPNISSERIYFNFNTDPPSVNIRPDTFSTGLCSASYCDDDGRILFFTNGLTVLNHKGEVVENGGGLNPTLPEWQQAYSYRAGQTCFFLEKPGNPNILYLITLDFGLHPAQDWPYIYVGQNVLATTIDKTANNGSGKVLEKNKILLTGTLVSPAASRHANGRDWWILTSDADKNRHYRILLSPEGFSDPIAQNIGTKPIVLVIANPCAGNCFSPSGKYYVDQHDGVGFSIFEFDRCSGLLSKEKRLNYPPPTTQEPNYYRHRDGSGAVFSPDEKLFYKTTTVNAAYVPWVYAGCWPYLMQFDLLAPTLAEAVDTINIIDSSDYSFPFNITCEDYYGAELGPDGRIYIMHHDSSLCAVEYPNVRGRGCKFVHDKAYFGTFIGIRPTPNFPNYRLGPLDGSSCDTLGLNNIPVAHFRIDDTSGMYARYFYDLSHHEPANWFWDFGDGSTSTEINPLHTFPGPDIYEVCLTVSNAYGSNTECRTLYLGVSNTAEQLNHPGLNVLPNPFRDQIWVQVETPLAAPEFRLYDQTGRLLRSLPLSQGKNRIDTGFLPAGVYFWQAFEGKRRLSTGKLLK